jgi:hypothetical protein
MHTLLYLLSPGHSRPDLFELRGIYFTKTLQIGGSLSFGFFRQVSGSIEEIYRTYTQNNKIIEQVKSFNYLGNMISYERELDIDNKLNNYLKITGILNNVFRQHKTP